MLEIIPIQSLGVAEDGGCLLEGNAVLSQVAKGLRASQENILMYIH